MSNSHHVNRHSSALWDGWPSGFEGSGPGESSFGFRGVGSFNLPSAQNSRFGEHCFGCLFMVQGVRLSGWGRKGGRIFGLLTLGSREPCPDSDRLSGRLASWQRFMFSNNRHTRFKGWLFVCTLRLRSAAPSTCCYMKFLEVVAIEVCCCTASGFRIGVTAKTLRKSWAVSPRAD